MTTTTILSDLTVLSGDQLATAWTIFDDRARAAQTSCGRTRAMNARERVGDEVSRRGFVIRRLTDGRFGCGRASDFEPIR